MTPAEIEWLRARLRDANSLEGPRATQAALAAVYQLLRENGIEHAELRPISRLQGALDDHARGKPHPLLTITRRRGQRSHTADNMFRCSVAAVATIFVGDLGYSRPEAIAKIATSLKVPARKIGTWYHEISNGRHANGEAFEQYEKLLSEIRPMIDGEPSIVEAALLRVLPSLAREKL